MIADLKPYPAIKDSGVPWLAKVPEHWEVLPNRAVFREVKERDHPDAEMLSVTITKGVIRQHALLEDSAKKDSSNQDKSAYKLVRPGDIAYNKMRAWQGAVGVSEYEGIVSPAYIVQRPREGVDPRYLHYLLRTPAFAKEAERWSYGITSDMWSLRPEHFKMIYSCLPPLPEQAAIVRFLDHADRRIRRYILSKQKLIKLLEEQKQAIIHCAVTRGLDSNVRLKPSCVEWLGDVPEHWEVKPVAGACTYISYGFTNPMPAADVGPYMLTANDIGDGEIRYETARRTTPFAFDNLLTKKSRPLIGDVLVTKDGTLGRIAVAENRPACINQSVALLRPDRTQIVPEFLALTLRAPVYRERMIFEAGGTTIKHIYITRLAKMRLAIPAIAEQLSVIGYVSEAISGLDKARIAADREIGLLREYRTRLIADVVTGKLDVREAAARLPNEVEEPEALDEGESESAAPDSGDNETDEVPEEAEA